MTWIDEWNNWICNSLFSVLFNDFSMIFIVNFMFFFNDFRFSTHTAVKKRTLKKNILKFFINVYVF